MSEYTLRVFPYPKGNPVNQVPDNMPGTIVTDPETGEIFASDNRPYSDDTVREAAVSQVPFLRTPYNYNRDLASALSGLVCPEPTRAQQQFAEESDINVIVKRFGLTGELPENVRMPTYGDFTQVSDFHTAANAIRQAEESFMAMPAEIRAEFNNDPARFVDFCSDPDNRPKALKLGLLEPAKAQTAPAQGVPPAPAPAAPPAPTAPPAQA